MTNTKPINQIRAFEALSSWICAILVIWLTSITSARAADEIPGRDPGVPVALIGGTLHTLTGPIIDKGTLLLENGRIVAIGTDVAIPDGAQRMDLTGKHVYPGLFDAYTNLGLTEVGAVRATRDFTETGQINPNVRAEVAVNPDSELIPVARSNGILLCLSAPRNRLISGSSAVIQLDGWTWEDLTVKQLAGMHLQWPPMWPGPKWHIGESTNSQIEKRDRDLRQLNQILSDARAYQKAKVAASDVRQVARQAHDARLEAIQPVLEGKMPLIVSADDLSQIKSAVALAVREDLKLIIHGGYDAPKCAELLKQYNVPVIIAGVYRLPLRRSDDYDAAFTLPTRLKSAGVQFCISSSDRFGAAHVRNLPYHAAMAVAYGLPNDEALKAITLYPAQILGLAHRVGSLEVSKDATLLISNGDPLVTTTEIQHAFIQGRPVDLNNRHKRLWHKYQEKYRRQGNQPADDDLPQ